MLETYIEIVQEEIYHLLNEGLQKESLRAAQSMILTAEKKGNRVHVMGIGKPSYVAGYIASLFSSTGTPTYLLDGTETVHGSSGQVKPEDIVIAISNSGETEELLASVRTLKRNGAIVIGLSNHRLSSLSQLSDTVLISKVDREGDNLNKPPRASILNQMILLQCLSILLQEAKGITIETYGNWHPGGTIGQSIKG